MFPKSHLGCIGDGVGKCSEHVNEGECAHILTEWTDGRTEKKEEKMERGSGGGGGGLEKTMKSSHQSKLVRRPLRQFIKIV